MSTSEPQIPCYGGRFELRRRLGEGGFGVVYQAFDRRRRALVALKELTRVEPKALGRFKNEFRALVDLAHPNLVTLYELFAEEGRWYFTMEYVEGVDFLTYVWGGGAGGQGSGPSLTGEPSMVPLVSAAERTHAEPPEPAAAAPGEEGGVRESATEDASTVDIGSKRSPAGARWRTPRVRAAPRAGVYDEARLRGSFAQLAAGVEALHASGRLHRDLKPTNVRVTREGRVVLLDFGLVLALGAAGEAERRELAGTPAYMSPEQACQQPVAEPTDCYAMGVMLFEALTGRRPFAGTVAGTLVSRAEEGAPAPRVFAPQAPADLDRLCSALLERDPAARPSAAQVRERAFGAAGTGPGPADGPGQAAIQRVQARPFVGRTAQLEALREAFVRSEAGQVSLALVSGPSGIGKSALLERFVAWVQRERPETVVLAGRCHQQESVPYKGVDAAVDALARFLRGLSPEERELYLCPDLLRLAQIFPVLLPLTLTSQLGCGVAMAGTDLSSEGALEARQVRQRAFGALRELLVRIRAVRPLLLLLDDLQWGDDDSGALLAEVLREPGAPPLCFVAATRSEEAERSPLLRRILGLDTRDAALPVPDRVELRPLPPEESALLAGLLLAGGAGGGVDGKARLAVQVARASEGNPFLLGELSWSVQQRHERDALADEPSVKRVVHRRISLLSPASRRLLEATALSGVPLRTELLLDAALSGEAGSEAIAALLAARLVRVHHLAQGEGLECYHDRIREAVAAQLTPEEARRCHTALVRVLQASEGGDPELIARHLVEAGDRQQALGWLLKAADRAMDALAFDRAARLYAEAVALGLRLPRGLLRCRQGEALAAAGRSAEAGRVFLRAAAEAPEGESLSLKLRAAELLLKGGHYDEGLPVTREVFGHLGMRLPAGRVEAYLQAAWELARLKLHGLRFVPSPEGERSPGRLQLSDACFAVAEPLQAVDPVLGYVLALRSTRHSLGSGDPFRACRALALHCVQTSMLEPCSRAPLEALDAARGLAQASGDPRLPPLLELASATAAFFRGDFHRALADGLEAEQHLREGAAGMQWESSTSALVILSALQWLGRWGELGHRLPEFLRAATDRGDLYGAAALSGAFGGFPGLAADDVDRADRDIATFRVQHSQSLRCVPQTYEVISRCYLNLYRGAGATTLSELGRRWPELKRHGLTEVPMFMIEIAFLRASALVACLADGARGGEADRLGRQARQALASLRGSGLPVGQALSALLGACLDIAQDRLSSGLSSLARVVPSLSALGLTLHVDAADHLRGRILGGVEGGHLVHEAESRMRAQGIWEGARLARVFAPG